MKDERTQAVIDLLSSLIMSHNGMLASEQYRPGTNADQSDDYITEHKGWVKELRDIRQRFENLVTGVVDYQSSDSELAKANNAIKNCQAVNERLSARIAELEVGKLPRE